VVEFCQSFEEPTESILLMEAAGSSETVDKTVPDYMPPHFYRHVIEYLRHYVTITHFTAVHVTRTWLCQFDSPYSESPGPHVDCDPLQLIPNELNSG
jgi:hypothetical protein